MKIVVALLSFLPFLVSCRFLLYDVEYRVTGSAASVDLEYTNSSGSLSQINGAHLPWTYSFAARRGDTAFIEVRIGASGGSAAFEILIDGRVEAGNTASGANALIDHHLDVGEPE